MSRTADKTFLGEVGDCNDPKSLSLCNAASEYGSAQRANSIFNADSMFGGMYGPCSTFAEYAYSPPQLVCDGEI